MKTLATPRTKKTDDNSEKTSILQYGTIKNRFNQIPQWVSDKNSYGFGVASKAAIGTYVLFWTLHPNFVITPRNLEYRAKKNGCSDTEAMYRSHLRQLEKMKLVFIKDNGKFLEKSYFVFLVTDLRIVQAAIDLDVDPSKLNDFYLNHRVKNISCSEKPRISENKASTKKPEKSPCNKNSTGLYNKVREYISTNTNSNSKGGAGPDVSKVPKNDTAIISEIELELDNSPSFDGDLVSQCLDSFGPEYTLEAIKVSKDKSDTNPGGYFRGAALKKYSWIELRLNQPPKKVHSTMSECNIQGYRIDFLDALFKAGDNDFQHFLDLTDDELANENRFQKFIETKDYQL